MVIEPWLPSGFRLSDANILRMALFEGEDWQLFETEGHGRALIVSDALFHRWLAESLVSDGQFMVFHFGEQQFFGLSAGRGLALCPVNQSKSPDDIAEAMDFAEAFKATRMCGVTASLHDALYVEKLQRLLPVYSKTSDITDDIVMGAWLTGGAKISVNVSGSLARALTWLSTDHLAEVLNRAGFAASASLMVNKPEECIDNLVQKQSRVAERMFVRTDKSEPFLLAGRPELTAFFNEHVIDIVSNREQYAAMGIGFPAPIILQGPPGCGKTYAVEQLVEYLHWPSFQIDASTIASPYIHETSKKIAEVFDKAIEQAPSVIVIDEMDAFLTDRQSEGHSHRVEEVAEFLRRIPQAPKQQVLILGMTNRIDIIDPAILRRGRFDYIINVDYANEDDVLALLEKLLMPLPKEKSLDLQLLATALARRPLSDVSFVVREGARLSVRTGQSSISQDNLLAALKTVTLSDKSEPQHRIGFI